MRPPESIETFFDSSSVAGEIPERIAVASTIGLNAEPGCRSACAARLNWLSRKFRPPYIARTAPVWGSMATSAAAGPSGSRSTYSIAVRAFCWSFRSIVVVTCAPPPKTFPALYRSTS